ncbi:cytochrome P450 family protein [Labilibaculum antarcticum]|uniref:Uncharacterized protein n=1 Tax=Labilibaculum antarcticum TaxID=1717717 RepID=A0A1Y1CMI9_9BACT|nr:hypothetical protein [Labilibaculum antarcticum]BAX81659.1 hypothetical protein ALGA_3361 [Labilibaculum antarcticum]
MENNLKFSLTKEESDQVDQAVNTLKTILEPKLISLAASDKRDMPKMGDKTLAFVEKSVGYGGMYPDFMPKFIDVDEAKTDLRSVKGLKQLLTPLLRITNELDDTMTMAGSEAYSSALSIYKVLKNAANMGQAGAQEASDDLKSRFPGKRKSAVIAE